MHAQQESVSSNSSPTSSSNSSSGIATSIAATNSDSSPPMSRDSANHFNYNDTRGSSPFIKPHKNFIRHQSPDDPLDMGDRHLSSGESTQTIVNGNGKQTEDDSGYQALDRLLATLALEKDIMNRHLSQINNNNSNSNGNGNAKSDCNGNPHESKVKFTNGHNLMHTNGNSNDFHPNLNDVIANLTDFTRHEQLRQQQMTNDGYYNGSTVSHHIDNNHNHHHNHVNLNHNNHFVNGNSHHSNHRSNQETSNNAIKRLTSESENSSSVSPSLSERSNGIVSWSDQVWSRSTHFPQCRFEFWIQFSFEFSKTKIKIQSNFCIPRQKINPVAATR